MKKLLSPLFVLALTGTAFAGPFDTLNSAALGSKPAAAPVPAAAAPASLNQKLGTAEGSFCFERKAADSAANDARLPVSFCVSKVSLERLPGGKMQMGVVSNNKEIKGGAAEYIFENGSLKYARVKVFDFFNEIYDGAIFLYAPVYPNGNLVPGAEPKVQAKAGIQPPDGDWMYDDVVYSKPVPPQPPAGTGPCFLRAPQEWADAARMPAKFCVKAPALTREADGGLKLSIQGELAGTYPAAYQQVNDKTFLKAVVFSKDTGGMEVYSGIIEVRLPVQPNGELVPGGQAQVEANAGYNWDVYHSDFDYKPVKFYAVAD